MEHRKNVLVRSGKSPFVRTSPLDALHRRTTLNNTGNLLFQHAFIRSIYQPGVASHCIQDGPFTDGDIERINAEFDAIYLPFANAFRVNYKSVLKNWGRAVRKLKIPVVIVGVGAQCESDDAVRELGPINDDVRDLCDAVLDKSSSIGVRGQFTANYLNELGVRNVDIIGCPSMFYFGAQLPRPKPVDFADPRLVAFHFSPQSPANFRSRNEHVDALFSAMLDFLGSQPDAGCTYIAQDTQELEQRVWNVKGMTLARYAPALAEIATLYPLDPHVWIQDLKSFDFALGTRIHGTIAAVLAGIPSLILCHDSRTSELADCSASPGSILRSMRGFR